MSEWKDISTAPKRGEYLVYQPLVVHPRSRVNDLPPRICLISGGGSRLSTHWMPLPSPPTHTPEAMAEKENVK